MRKTALLLITVALIATPTFAQQEEQETSLLQEVLKLYDQAVDAGETVSKDVYTWVQDDIQHIGDWEYKVVSIPNPALEHRLNELGAERWEAIWLDRRGDTIEVTLKRSSRTWLNKLPIGELLKMATPEGGSGSE